ncbi:MULTISPECIES: sensor histidine kinase [Marivita]|jgi:signal transduction histidine kinase|uniref:histidine kinase n=1 Tax=Marivita cryptomonadis TaxID=505252 RepID=A0A9Q2S245_9RHOB|nr:MULTISPECIES: HAMP domain-containing sensor histidine kinase [Marivita]MCR9170794.1 HAMP domain-containing histidine kinase [Paracoccaceae bacterium]MBM2324241.1 HAMP domain-containing histidine kinase [Marivita cryptomonadis]MBM2333833.1 HAMP domain-containing histidine kinase [Marivita cryptomonadis]MBM2343408.1 HAMP domain-containing histidine kinase [Marivita cryptomonadis]MBM2348081.1 HAMP domain-containing histidine kinase [Marivita cryptomonadis]
MKWFAPIPLSIKLPLLAAAMMVLVGTVASQQVLRALAQVQDARIQELARMHVEGLSVALGPLVLRNDIWEVYDTLDRAAQGNEGRRMVLTAVADERGRVLAATDPRRVPMDSDIAALAGDAVALDDLSVDGASNILSLLAPLTYQGRTVGQIATELDVADLLSERRQALLYLIMGNAIAIGLLSCVGFLSIRKMLQPVTTLARQMTETKGEPHPIPTSIIPRGDGELARLARTYNSMVGAVAAKAEAERRLAERERFVALGRLSSSLAHEINNPLGGLLNVTDTIRSYSDRPEVVRQSADLLDRGLRHLRDVTRATLDQNRIDPETRILKLDDFEDIKLLIQPEVSRLALELEWSVDPDAVTQHSVPAGPVRQITLNLLLNACTAAGQTGHVGLMAHSKDGNLSVQVTNTGLGMPETALDRLLGDGPLSPGGGVGLRLVREIAKSMGGTISHAHEEGVTRIVVSLPASGEVSNAQE